MRVLFPLVVLALLLPAGAVSAQSASKCPDLDPASGLSWQTIHTDALLFCRAVRDDGSGDAFSMTFTRKPTFSPDSRKSVNASTFAGMSLQWYRSTLAGNPDIQIREALVPLDDGQNIQFVVRATDDAGLQRAFGEISALRVSAVAAR